MPSDDTTVSVYVRKDGEDRRLLSLKRPATVPLQVWLENDWAIDGNQVVKSVPQSYGSLLPAEKWLVQTLKTYGYRNIEFC